MPHSSVRRSGGGNRRAAFTARRGREIRSWYSLGRWPARSSSLSGRSVSSGTRFTHRSHSLIVGSSSRSCTSATFAIRTPRACRALVGMSHVLSSQVVQKQINLQFSESSDVVRASPLPRAQVVRIQGARLLSALSGVRTSASPLLSTPSHGLPR
jgi:hypothetical protein